MPFGLGVGELLIILAVLLLVFGAKRLPELGGALGKGIREFKSSVRDIEGEFKSAQNDSRREVDRSPPSRPAVSPPDRTEPAQPGQPTEQRPGEERGETR